MGGVPVMTQPTLIYSQPVMRPPNPFGPISGAQVGFNLHSAALKPQGGITSVEKGEISWLFLIDRGKQTSLVEMWKLVSHLRQLSFWARWNSPNGSQESLLYTWRLQRSGMRIVQKRSHWSKFWDDNQTIGELTVNLAQERKNNCTNGTCVNS